MRKSRSLKGASSQLRSGLHPLWRPRESPCPYFFQFQEATTCIPWLMVSHSAAPCHHIFILNLTLSPLSMDGCDYTGIHSHCPESSSHLIHPKSLSLCKRTSRVPGIKERHPPQGCPSLRGPSFSLSHRPANNFLCLAPVAHFYLTKGTSLDSSATVIILLPQGL